MRSEFSPPGRECRLLCLGFGGLGARSRPGCHPTVAAAPSSTVCGERHGAREIHRRTTKIIHDGDVVGVELCGENGHPGSRVRPSFSVRRSRRKRKDLHGAFTWRPSAHIFNSTTWSLSGSPEKANLPCRHRLIDGNVHQTLRFELLPGLRYQTTGVRSMAVESCIFTRALERPGKAVESISLKSVYPILGLRFRRRK